MTHLLYLNASPRGQASASVQACEHFLGAVSDTVTVTRLDLFEVGLPELTPEIASAKQKFMMGMDLSAPEAEQWAQITALVEQFVSADHYLLGVPMWNFSVPYKLKQYIDLITHPGLTFTRDEQGIRGLASGGAAVVYARGGDYSPKDGKPDPFDFQSPYLSAWLGLVGLAPVTEVLVQTTMAGPDALGNAVDAAKDQLVELAQAL